MQFIDLKTQYARQKELIDHRIHAVLDHGQYIMGPEVAELEEQLAAWTNSRACIACSSGTDALLIALMALGIGAGDEVVTTSFSFIATLEVITLVGAAPVLVDIDPLTYNLDARGLEAAITARTRAILPVSLYGQCADMDTIQEIADRHLLPVIEDAAQSFGATYKKRSSCNLSTIGCTSFFPSKPLGCYGDGGACFTNDEELAARMRQIRVHGQRQRYLHTRIGINGRLDTVQAAVLLAKLETFAEEREARGEAAYRYDRLLDGVAQTPVIAPENTSAYAQYTIRVQDRAAVQEALRVKGIPTAVHYPLPLHLQPVCTSWEAAHRSLPHAEEASQQVLSLPMHPYLSESDQRRVAEAIAGALAEVKTTSGIAAEISG